MPMGINREGKGGVAVGKASLQGVTARRDRASSECSQLGEDRLIFRTSEESVYLYLDTSSLAPAGGLILIISAMSPWVGRKESWATGDSTYFGFITALNIGYGDMRPSAGSGKLIAVAIALFGLITTVIMIAVAVKVAWTSFDAQAAAALGGG